MSGRVLTAVGRLPRVCRALRREDGVALITASLVTFAVFTVATVWLSVGLHQAEGSRADHRREQALAAADAGITVAMSHLSVDAAYTGTNGRLYDGTGEYDVTVMAVNPSDPFDLRRYIVARGYAPTRTSPLHARRRVEQQVELAVGGGFRYALFASPGGIAASNHLDVTGDVYANADLTLADNTSITGNVTSLGSIITTNNSTLGGTLRAAGSITVDNSSTTVVGDAYAGGGPGPVANVTMTGCVQGLVQAAGSITGSPPAGCPRRWTPNAPPLPPAGEALPTFTWDPANYSPAPITWPSPAAFVLQWQLTKGAFSGTHRVLCPAPCLSGIALDAKWTMTGDVTIVSDAPVTMSRDVSNGTAHPVNLTVVSLASAAPAITLTNNMTLPASISTLLFAGSGSIVFANQKDFHGAVYARSVTVDQFFTLHHEPVAPPGFAWSLASTTRYTIRADGYREVPFA